MKDYIDAFLNIFNYKDESTFKQFWNFFLINFLVDILVRFLVKKFSLPQFVFNIYSLIIIMTLISIGYRRLKNAGFSGWLFLFPIINLILALYPQKKSINNEVKENF